MRAIFSPAFSWTAHVFGREGNSSVSMPASRPRAYQLALDPIVAAAAPIGKRSSAAPAAARDRRATKPGQDLFEGVSSGPRAPEHSIFNACATSYAPRRAGIVRQ